MCLQFICFQLRIICVENFLHLLQILYRFDGKALSFKDQRNMYDHNKHLIVNMTQKVKAQDSSCTHSLLVSQTEPTYFGTDVNSEIETVSSCALRLKAWWKLMTC